MWITGARKAARALSTGDSQVAGGWYSVSQPADRTITACFQKRKISYPQDFGSLIITI
jgi:hypothetical protein